MKSLRVYWDLFLRKFKSKKRNTDMLNKLKCNYTYQMLYQSFRELSIQPSCCVRDLTDPCLSFVILFNHRCQSVTLRMLNDLAIEISVGSYKARYTTICSDFRKIKDIANIIITNSNKIKGDFENAYND